MAKKADKPDQNAVTHAAPPANSPLAERGVLSDVFESGGRGPEIVSSGMMSHGRPDPGGPSYGSHQLTSQDSFRGKDHKIHIVHNGGNVGRFLKQEGQPWAGEFEGLRPGSAEFTQRWKEVAGRDREAFAESQRGFIDRTHYQPQARHIHEAAGVDLSQRSRTLQNVVLSTSVQHGPNTKLIGQALEHKAAEMHKTTAELTDRECFGAIYERRRQAFPQTAARYEREEQMANRMLDYEEHNPHASLQEFARQDQQRQHAQTAHHHSQAGQHPHGHVEPHGHSAAANQHGDHLTRTMEVSGKVLRHDGQGQQSGQAQVGLKAHQDVLEPQRPAAAAPRSDASLSPGRAQPEQAGAQRQSEIRQAANRQQPSPALQAQPDTSKAARNR